MKLGSMEFLDAAVLELAKGGPQGTWQVGLDGTGPSFVSYQDRDAWASRVLDDALALAAARERKLLDAQAIDADFGQDGGGDERAGVESDVRDILDLKRDEVETCRAADAADPARAPSSPAAERADEGRKLDLHGDCPGLMRGPHDLAWEGDVLVCRLCKGQDARAQRAKPVNVLNVVGFVSDLDAMFRAAPGPFSVPTQAALEALAVKHTKALLDSVVVDREGYYALKKAQQERDALAAKLAECEESLDLHKSIRAAQGEAIGKFVKERDEARAKLTEMEAASAEHIRFRDDAGKSWTLRELHEEIARLRTAPPTVAVTDVEKAAKEIAEGFELNHDGDNEILLSILRDCTRAVSVEEVAKAMQDEAHRYAPSYVGSWASCHEAARGRTIAGVGGALRALGVREATPFVVDREKVQNAIFRSPDWIDDVRTYPANLARRAADAAITEYERQRAEHEKGGAA